MKRIPTLFIALLCILLHSKAQDIVKRCAIDEINTQSFLNNPTLTETYLREISGAVNNIVTYDTTLANTDSVYTVQVVVHVVYLNNNKYENIPDSIIQSQIDALNRDFNAKNADSVNLRPFFIPFRGNAKIKFELAKFRPNGAPTNGILRVQGKLGGSGGYNPIIDNVKRPDDIFTGLFGSGSPSWPVSRYLNIWVCDLNYATRKCPTCLTLCDTCGALGGYAYPPANAINWGGLALERGSNDGVVIDFRFFGLNNWYAQDSTSQRFRDFYSNGRTTVHEIGHYLGMQHSWGNVIPIIVPDGCAVDDFIDDTPEEQNSFSSFLVRGTTNPCDSTINSCTKNYLGRDWPDMYENYMNYSSDLCYNLFTKQQVNLMRFNLLTRRQNLIIKRELEPTIPTAIRNPRIKDYGISIFPNPANDVLTIQFTNQQQKALTLELFDITGKTIMASVIQPQTHTFTTDVKSLASGIYMIKLSNETITVSEKFIKE